MAFLESPSLASKLRARMLKHPIACVSRDEELRPSHKSDTSKHDAVAMVDSTDNCLQRNGDSVNEMKQSSIPQNQNEMCLNQAGSNEVCHSKESIRKRLADGQNQNDSGRSSNENGAKKRKEGIDTHKEELQLTDQELSLARNLWQEMQGDKPPTPACLKPLGVKALIQLLRFNERPVYQGMDLNHLAHMVQDYMKNGCPPPCPKCAKGKLRFSNGKKRYGKRYFWCPGFTNNGQKFYGCNFKADRLEISRVPWKCP